MDIFTPSSASIGYAIEELPDSLDFVIMSSRFQNKHAKSKSESLVTKDHQNEQKRKDEKI